MTAYKGFVKVTTKSFEDWRKAIIGNAYDVDGYYGYQCFDLANIFWKNAVGYYPKTATKDGGKKNCASGLWGARDINNKNNDFELIYDYKNLKKGDVIITNNGECGHVCFLDQDYNDDTYLKVLGQNQGGTNGKLPGAKVKDIEWAFRKYFLGAFRLRVWHTNKYTKGVYKTLCDMNIRKSPNGEKVKVKDCTDAMKKALTSKSPNAYAVVKKGTNFTALEIVKNDGYWAKNYSGYICIEQNENKYCKKV